MTLQEGKAAHKRFAVQDRVRWSDVDKAGIIYFGSTNVIMDEACAILGTPIRRCRIRSFPFPPDVASFLESCEEIFVVEQNRDGQMKTLLSQEFPQHANKFRSILHFDGTPISADFVADQISQRMNHV